MGIDGALQKLAILESELPSLVLELALQYSGGHIQTPRKPRKKPGTGGRPVSGGRPRQPVIVRHFTFANQGFYPPLSEQYAKRKAKRVGLKPMLVYSGRLKKSIVSRGTIKSQGPERALITWLNVPNYTKFQAMLGRDPVEPTRSDKALLLLRAKEIVKRQIRRKIMGVTGTASRTGRIA